MDRRTTYASIAASSCLLPLAPQYLQDEELRAIAGGLVGWDTIADCLDPDLAEWRDRYGCGLFDGTLKTKLQTWFSGWVAPPEHYVLHAPRLANGQWIRIWRSCMSVAAQLEQAKVDRAELPEGELTLAYEPVLGVGSSARNPETWWNDTLLAIQQGSWHIAVYSADWEAFVSPFGPFPPIEDPLQRARAEFPKVEIALYPTGADGAFDLSQAIAEGAYIEILGERKEAPPLGKWGPGVFVLSPLGLPRLISGIIHRTARRVQVAAVEQGPVNSVIARVPDQAAFLKDVYTVTGWRPEALPAELFGTGRMEALQSAVAELTHGLDEVVPVPGEVFADALMSPAITPVCGRLMSTVAADLC